MQDPSSEEVRIAVVTDLHAYEPDAARSEDPPSHLSIASPEDQPNQHPITGLIKLITDERITADFLVCCGDLGDKARPSATKYAWERIHKIRSALGSRLLVATPGNHDLDSRYIYNDYDAKGVLQTLTPPFPLDEPDKNDHFWSRNFVLLNDPVTACRFLVINSAAYHGGKEARDLPWKDCVPNDRSHNTCSGINPTWSSLNIAVCHHHPLRYSDITVEDYSEMSGGQNLIDILGSGRFGRWVIIHGHKHHPRICYGAGSAASPIIFSAGSLCAILYSAIQNRARNQFYVIEFPVTRFDKLRLELVGRFFAWDWITGSGWKRAGRDSGLPAFGGFGYRPEVIYDAQDIARFTEAHLPWVTWREIVANFPKLEFMLPADLARIEQQLSSGHGLSLLRDNNELITQIGKYP